MKRILVLFLFFIVCFSCQSREIFFEFFDTDGHAIDDVTINITISTLMGNWQQFNGLKKEFQSIRSKSKFSFFIDEKSYSLTFSFEKKDFFPESWFFPVYSTDMKKDVVKPVFLSKRIKNDNIISREIVLSLDILNNEKTVVFFKDILGELKSNNCFSPQKTSLFLDVYRDKIGNPVYAPISNFNSHRLWPKYLLLKLDNFSIDQGFLPVRNLAIKEMRSAPQKGYSPFLEVDPRKSELFFYFLIDGYFGKGIIRSLYQKKDKQWEMRILFILNSQKNNNDLQSDSDYALYP